MAGMTAGTACDWEDPYLWTGGTSLPIHSLLGAFKLAVQTLNNNISFPRPKRCKEIKRLSKQEIFCTAQEKKIIYHSVLLLR